MEKIARIIIEDEVNISIKNIDISLKRDLMNAVKFFIPEARYSYSFKTGRWDGTKSFCSLGGRTYLNILDKLLPIIIESGYEFQIDDQRVFHTFDFQSIDENFLANQVWPDGHRFAGEPIVLRDHQAEHINICINNLQGVDILPTSAGKTLVTAALSKIVEKYGRSIVIVPNKNLVMQTEEDYRNIGLDVGVLFGDRKEYDRTHTICTWQSLNVLDKKSKNADPFDPDQLDVFLKDLVCVICDECHQVTDTNIIHSLMTGIFKNIPIRWGLTGTLPEEEYKQMGLFTAIGPQIGNLTAKELQEKGILAKCQVHVIQTQETRQYNSYQDEIKFLVTDEDRLTWLARTIQEISKTGNTLVLVDRIETGERISTLLDSAIFVSGKMKSKNRSEHYKELNFSDNKIMVATFGTTSTGISISRIFNLVLLECGKSFTRVIQSIGRGLRMADDKDSVEIYDICSKMKFSNAHLTKRKAFYKKVGYPFDIQKVILQNMSKNM